MKRHTAHTDRQIDRLGLGLAVSICLAVAIFTRGDHARASFIAASVATATVWLGLEGWWERRGFVSALVLLAVGSAGLFVAPSILLVSDPGLLWEGPMSLTPGLEVYAVALPSLIVGAIVVRLLQPDRKVIALLRRFGQLRPVSNVPRRRWLVICGLVLVSLTAFFVHVGGPAHYFKNLDRSSQLNAGATYLIWGVLIAKFATFAAVGETWRKGERLTRILFTSVLLSLALVGLIGARLLIVVALAQLLLLFSVFHGASRRSCVMLIVVVTGSLLVIVALGEFRRWESLGGYKSFDTYLVEDGLPKLSATYVNQYADGLRTALIARKLVPGETDFEYGKELLRIALHPIPAALRPQVEAAPPLARAFASAPDTGNSLSLPVAGFIQFGIIGVAVFSMLLGALAAFVDRCLARQADVGFLLALLGATTGSVMILRGSLVGGIAFGAMDVIGFYAVHRFLYAGLRRSASLRASGRREASVARRA